MNGMNAQSRGVKYPLHLKCSHATLQSRSRQNVDQNGVIAVTRQKL